MLSFFLLWRSGRAEISAVRAGLFPWVIGTPTLLLALFQLAKDLRGTKKSASRHSRREWRSTFRPQWRAVEPGHPRLDGGFLYRDLALGFFLCGAVDDGPLFEVRGQREMADDRIMAFFTWVFIYLLFERMLSVPFPDGLILLYLRGSDC